MLEFKLARSTQNGKQAQVYYQIIRDETFKKTWTPGVNQFVLDHTVRKMINCKNMIEDLRVMPIFLLDGEDVTSSYLPQFIESLEKYFGPMKYTSEQNKQTRGSMEYLEKNNVSVGDVDV